MFLWGFLPFFFFFKSLICIAAKADKQLSLAYFRAGFLCANFFLLMETQQYTPLFSQGGYKVIRYPRSSSCHVRSWKFLKSTIFLRITCSTLCQHTQHSQETCLPTLFNNPCYSLEAQNSEAQRSKTFTYLHSSTVVSPILEIKIREFRQGWEFEKEKEPRPPAHQKFREGKENRFQVLAPLSISNPGIRHLFVKIPRY